MPTYEPDTLVAISGDIAAAATALAGLILVYLGALAASYSAYNAEFQSAVRPYYRKHARFAFSGLVIGLIAAAMALFAEATKFMWAVELAAAALCITFIAAVIAAGFTVNLFSESKQRSRVEGEKVSPQLGVPDA